MLTRMEGLPSLPAGEYRFGDTIQSSNGDDELTVRVEISIAEGGVSVQETVERS